MFPERSAAFLYNSNQWYHRMLQPVFDLMALAFAWRLALSLRLALNPLMSVHFSPGEIVRLAPPLGQILLLWLVVLPWLGLYRRDPDNSVSSSLLRVAPGITRLWQISGRSDTTFEQMTQLDIDYIRTWSLKLDLRIMLVTPLVVITGRGAY